MANLRNFILDSDYPMDNIILVATGDATKNGNYWTFEAPHGLPYKPLLFGLFSTDNGSTWSNIDYTALNAGGITVANSTTAQAQLWFYSGSPTRVMVRLFGFAPSDVSGSINPPVAISDFHINTDYLYDSLVEAGVKNLSSSSSFQTITTHNLGYLPRVMMWYETQQNTIQRVIGATDMGDGFSNIPKVTDTILQFKLEGDSLRLHYRLYGRNNG